MKLLRHSVLVAIVILVVYEILCRQLSSKMVYWGAENQWIRNAVVAQRYLYGRADAPIVIAGTSLSVCLRDDLLPTGVFNLSFSGLSALDAIKIVLRAKTRPKTLFVEANVLSKNFDRAFDDRILNPGLFVLRRWLVSLRDEARPLGASGNYLMSGSRRLRGLIHGAAAVDTSRLVGPVASTTTTSNRMLAIHQRTSQTALSEHDQESLAAELRADVTALGQRGTTVIFFEMPIHPTLCKSPWQTSIRVLLRRQFPEQRHVRFSECGMVATVDGVHLTTEESDRVTGVFAPILEQAMQAQPSHPAP